MLAGSVDAFSVALQTNPPHDFFTINAGSISVFKIINVNIRGGYDINTGKRPFTLSINVNTNTLH